MHMHCSAEDGHILILNSLWFLYVPTVSTLIKSTLSTQCILKVDTAILHIIPTNSRFKEFKNRKIKILAPAVLYTHTERTTLTAVSMR